MSPELGSTIGIGLDLAEVNRFRRLGSTHPFFVRVFTASERDYCMSYPDPFPHFAGLFAAKEAVIKALSSQSCLAPHTIEIDHTPSGSPQVHVHADVEQSIILSISHTRRYAIAVALAIGKNDAIDLDELSHTIEPLVVEALSTEVKQNE